MAENLRHIVLIPDGNRRWAKAQGKLPMQGHDAAARSSEGIIKSAFDEGIEYVTIWGCSVSNLTERSAPETAFLKNAFQEYFKRLHRHPQLQERDIRVRVLGRWREYFTKGAIEAIEKVLETTAAHSTLNLTFLLGYSGMDEMLQAIKRLKDGGEEVSAESLKAALWTAELPPVDLVIRTGGEPHWSQGFMMWDVAEAQLHFTKTLWPAFTPDELKEIIDRYRETERRHGA